MKAVSSLIVSLAAMVAISACSGSERAEVAWYTPEEPGVGFAASADGSLVRKDGCLYFDTAGGLTLPLFDFEPELVGEVLRTPGGDLPIGEPVTLGGAFIPNLPERAMLPEACDGSLPMFQVTTPQ